DRASLVGLQIDGDRALPAIPAEEPRQLAERVAVQRLDLDDIRAEIRQHHRRVRSGDVAGQVDDPNPLERRHVIPRRGEPRDENGPDARRRPKAAREAYSLYVERAAEGANEADGSLSSRGDLADDEFAVMITIAVHRFERLGVLEIEVQVVLPREPDAAVH